MIQNDTWWEIKKIKACAVYNQTGSTWITATTMDINNLKHKENKNISLSLIDIRSQIKRL